jgi:exodeoxyribonuclease-3
MKIYSWNVNGLRSVINKGVFLPFIEAHRPDVLCLQETKSEQSQVDIDLPDYHEYWNSASTKGYSGHGHLLAHQAAVGAKWLLEDHREEVQPRR